MANVKSPWDTKFLRETPFIAFGSMMNAYGRMNEGKEITPEEFEKIANKLFQIAKGYAIAAFGAASTDDEVDLPVKQ